MYILLLSFSTIIIWFNWYKYYRTDDLEKFLYDKFNFEISINLPAIYFDHKCAGSMSTYSTIYEGLFKDAPSIDKIIKLECLYKIYHQKQEKNIINK